MSDNIWEFSMSPETPDWEYWKHIPTVSIDELCAIALNVSPSASQSIIKDFQSANRFPDDYFGFWISEADITSMYIEANNKICRIIIGNLDFNHGTLKTFKNSSYTPLGDTNIKFTDFVALFGDRSFPLPDYFPGVGNFKPDSRLTRGEKSSITQQNNQLKKMLKELVSHHYDEGVTAYRISQDIATTEPTIKKHLFD